MQLPGTTATMLGLSEKVTATSADFVSYDTCERPVFLASSHTANIAPLICTDVMVVPNHLSDSAIINCTVQEPFIQFPFSSRTTKTPPQRTKGRAHSFNWIRSSYHALEKNHGRTDDSVRAITLIAIALELLPTCDPRSCRSSH